MCMYRYIFVCECVYTCLVCKPQSVATAAFVATPCCSCSSNSPKHAAIPPISPPPQSPGCLHVFRSVCSVSSLRMHFHIENHSSGRPTTTAACFVWQFWFFSAKQKIITKEGESRAEKQKQLHVNFNIRRIVVPHNECCFSCMHPWMLIKVGTHYF